jgi:ribosomal protein S18 acetylase RimI-like enzyme
MTEGKGTPAISIRRATQQDAALLTVLASDTFRESHGHSAIPTDIEDYIRRTYSVDQLREELQNAANIYHLLYTGDTAIGFSKVVLNAPHPAVTLLPVAKLERIYLLEAFHSAGLGKTLFDFNIELVKAAGQRGIWLFTWTENHRAVRFYQRQGFRIIGSHSFAISQSHSNPNHQMLLVFVD